MIKTFRFAILSAGLLLIASCKANMTLSDDAFTVTPQVLEEIGGQVPVTINGIFPEKYFQKKAVVTVTPVLKWQDGSAKGNAMTFQGEKIVDNNIVVKKKEGYAFNIKFSFPYQPEMAKSELFMTFDATVKGKAVEIPAIKIADGVISTEDLYRSTSANANSAVSEDAYQRIIKEAQEANIMFAIQQSNVRADQKKSDDMKTFKEYINLFANDTKNYNVDNLEVSAYASPDGGITLNERLAGQREKNAMQYIKKEMKSSKFNTQLDSKYTAEDWDGFQKLVEKSNLQDKDLILRVLSMYTDPERREQEIKNLSSVYAELADEILPQLRRARLTLNYQIIGRSDEEILETYKSDPRSLSCNELLYAATLFDRTGDKAKVYTATSQIYPNDYRAFNDLGIIAFEAGDYETAHQMYHKALALNANAPEIHTNLSNMLLAQGKVAEAQNHLSKGGDSKENKEALGASYIALGQYARAIETLKGSNTESEALAYVLNKDYTNATKVLNAIGEPTANTYYLKAIIAARTNDAGSVKDNLKKSIAADASMKAKAATDLEFAKYQDTIDTL
ncbi:MAG: tetratricopeptide repeat protein [Bacteroidaceae bacterium]|nr:tetratricopeptide repeat protein [Bacteroidaceae bacterium]